MVFRSRFETASGNRGATVGPSASMYHRTRSINNETHPWNITIQCQFGCCKHPATVLRGAREGKELSDLKSKQLRKGDGDFRSIMAFEILKSRILTKTAFLRIINGCNFALYWCTSTSAEPLNSIDHVTLLRRLSIGFAFIERLTCLSTRLSNWTFDVSIHSFILSTAATTRGSVEESYLKIYSLTTYFLYVRTSFRAYHWVP